MRKTIITIIVGFIIAITSPFIAIAANDTPHNASKTVSCGNCHGKALLYSPFWGGSYTPTNIDDTVYNKICLECHTQSGGPYTTTNAPLARTHSSLATDNGYGNWTRECRDCHNPHYQKQSYYKIADSSNLYLARGTITSCGAYDSINNETTLTYSGITYKTGWDSAKLLEKTGSYRRTMLVPNVGKLGYNYPIIAIDGTTIKVEGNATAAYQYISPPTTFAVMYGQYIKDLINVGGTNKTVKFLDKTGTKSFADGDTTYDGVCEVCHTQTTYHRNSSAGDHTHYAATNCTTCHLHAEGFKGAGCNACHGFPPPPLATTPLPTGSTTAGAHVLHATTKGYACAKCHYNSAGGSGTHNNNIITLGFVNLLGAYTGGSYDGQATANYQSSDAGTTVSKLGSKTCGSIYCHSTGQSTTNGNDPTPTYAAPVWDDTATGDCGTCHKVTEAGGLISGSHAAHLGTVGVNGCGDCHTGAANDASVYNSTNHVNGLINAAGGYNKGGAPGNGYGTCNATLCHDNGTGTPAVTPTWGTAAAACAACHAAEPATASHTKHLSTTQYTKAVCGDCHDAAVKSTTAPTQHLDGNLDVYDVAAGDLGYPPDEPKGGAPYKTCTTAYCHSTGQSTTNGNSATPTYATATWGGAAACGTCHKVTEASGLTSGSHGQHLGTTGVNGCGDCHTDAANDASAYNSTAHVNRLIDAAGGYNKGGAPGNGYGTCNTASCHDDGTGNPAVTPTWGTAAAACAACHAAAPATGSHTKHLTTTDFVQAVCGDCHDGTVQGTTAPVTHLDGNLDVYDAAAGDLGYPQNVAKGGAPYDSCTTAYCHSNGSGTYKSATWGGTSTGCNFCHDALPTTNAHLKHVVTAATTYGSTTVSSTAGSYDFGCGNCHPTDKNLHANGTVDISLNPADGGTLKSKNDATANKTGSGATTVCNKIYCHSNGASGAGSNIATAASPAWNATLTGNKCGACHDNPPQYAGQSHYNATGFMSKEGGHLVGIHFDNIYNGTNGLATSGTGNTNSHGNSAYSTTITCYICHNGEVSSATIDTYALNNLGSSSMKCGNCHTGATPTPLQNGAITNKSLHVNAVKNVTIAPAFTMKSKAQLRTSSLPSGWTRNVGYKAAGAYDSATINSSDWNSGDKTCTTACHNGQTVIWGDTNVTCNSCHTELP